MECEPALCREIIGNFSVHTLCERERRCIVDFRYSSYNDIAFVDDILTVFVNMWERYTYI